MDIFAELRKKIKDSSTRVVFPEGREEKILMAAARIVEQKIATPLVLGETTEIQAIAAEKKINLTGITIKKPADPAKMDTYVAQYSKDRNFPAGATRRLLSKPLYYGAMMVKMNDADAMVAGITSRGMSCAKTIIPASGLIIGMQKGITTPSSFFLMDIPGYKGEEGSLLIFADAAINPDPTPEELADIALASAASARNLLGWEPRVALLSFSTKGSGEHPTVNKVIEAVRIIKQHAPDLHVDGELQADAALAPKVAKRKIKGPPGPVAGRANVLIFPDLNAGNISYKLVQHLANAKAFGPILQGFARPVSDLSRGATVDDIIGATTLVVLEVQAHDNSGY